MKFLCFGESGPQLMLRVELTDGQIFDAPAEDGDSRILLGTNFVRVEMGGDTRILYPMHRVFKVTFYREGDK